MLNISTAVKIRLFSRDDLKVILAIQKACQLAAGWGLHDYEQLASDPRGMILVAELEGRTSLKVLGFSVSYRVDEEAELWNIGVAPQYQRRGIARALLRETCQKLSHAGAQRLFLEVRDSNVPAIELYHSIGFTRLASRKDYYQNPSEDALVMIHKLAPADI